MRDPTVLFPIVTLGVIIFGIIHGIVYASRAQKRENKPHVPSHTELTDQTRNPK